MQTDADIIIDALGGTSAVADMTENAVSTVHSWRSNGIPRSRMAHLRFAADASGKGEALNAALAAIESRAGCNAPSPVASPSNGGNLTPSSVAA